MTKQIYSVSNLEKYYQKQHVLHDITFSIDEGEVVVLLGPSGSGKSTLNSNVEWVGTVPIRCS